MAFSIVKFLEDAGRICREYQDEVLRDLPCERLEPQRGAGQESAAGSWGGVDMDGDLRRHRDHPDVAHRRPHQRDRAGLHG